MLFESQKICGAHDGTRRPKLRSSEETMLLLCSLAVLFVKMCDHHVGCSHSANDFRFAVVVFGNAGICQYVLQSDGH